MEESLLNLFGKPVHRAATALLLVVVLLLSANGAGPGPKFFGQRTTELSHRSGDLPFLPQRIRPKVLSSHFGLRSNSTAVKYTSLFGVSPSGDAIDEMTRPLSANDSHSVRLLYLLRNTSPDRAPPHRT